MGAELKYKSLKGMPDILPEKSQIIREIEEEVRSIFRKFGYGEICTPLLEDTEVFTRSIGAYTDIVEKEMYSFEDRGGNNISLRPEGTASVLRAYIEHGWHNDPGLAKLFYMGPMFRAERPQKGRLRQFHQIGAEIIGASSPYVDADLLMSLWNILKKIEVGDFTLFINSLGCAIDREKYQKVLSIFLNEELDRLCENCRRRSKKNVLRVLDCKVEECKTVVRQAPAILDHLCEECLSDYVLLKNILTEAAITFTEKKDLVRGLDYYSGTIFEVVSSSLGAQDTIAAGGRYDGLTKKMGGPDVGAIGYAIGVERLLMLLNLEKYKQSNVEGILVIPMDKTLKLAALKLSQKFRDNGIRSEIDLSGRSFKAQMRRANKLGWRYVSILGEEEISMGNVHIKDMNTGSQSHSSFEAVLSSLKEHICCDN